MPAATSIDLTGLPEPVVREVLEIVRAAREAPGTPPPRHDPARWSAELRAWAASHPVRDLTLDDDRESIYAGCGE